MMLTNSFQLSTLRISLFFSLYDCVVCPWHERCATNYLHWFCIIQGECTLLMISVQRFASASHTQVDCAARVSVA